MMRLLFTSGRGPVECRLAVRHAIEAIGREAERAGVGCDVTAIADRDGRGYVSAIAVLACDHDPMLAQRLGARWLGAVLWITQSPVRRHHKRKNWYIGVVALDAPPEAPAALKSDDIRVETFRAGGPGGQHQNKTDSAVRALHIPSGLVVVVRDGRSQHRNKALALKRLAALLAMDPELQRAREDADIRAAHDRLERGNPVRTFRGADFEE